MDSNPSYQRALSAAALGLVLPLLVIVLVGLVPNDSASTDQFAAVQHWVIFGIAAGMLVPLVMAQFRANWAMHVLAFTAALATLALAHTAPASWMLVPGLIACITLLGFDWNTPARVATMAMGVTGAAAAYSAFTGIAGTLSIVALALFPLASALRIETGSTVRIWTLRILFACSALYAVFSITSSVGASDPSLLVGAVLGGIYAATTGGLLWNAQLASIHITGGIRLDSGTTELLDSPTIE